MLNSTILIKVKQRLNKLSSNDYDNIESWQIIEAFNKAQVDWCRRNLHGMNTKQEGDEQSTRRIDDLQTLLTKTSLVLSNKQTYYESINFPTDYLQWKRISIKAKNDCCNARNMVVYLGEQANVDELLRDKNKQPSFEWSETFATLSSNQIQIYTSGKFEVTEATFHYFRQPTRIQIAGIANPYDDGIISTVDVNSEFKDDLVELFIDETVKVIAGDIESMTQFQRMSQSVEQNN